MKQAIAVVTLLFFPVFLLTLGCGGEPTKQLTDAKDALEKAKMAEADKYAQDLFIKAENSITEAENLIAQKKYGEAKKLLMEAKAVADQAASQAQVNLDNMEAEVADFLSEIDQTMQGLEETQNVAKKWGIPKAQWELKQETTRWHEQMQKVRDDYDKGEYYSARELAGKILDEVTDADSRIKEMIQAKEK
jgi:hypothetical protein